MRKTRETKRGASQPKLVVRNPSADIADEAKVRMGGVVNGAPERR